jgi:hypothetical protein
MSTCRSCGAEVILLRHELTGNWAPINATPDPAGNIVIDVKLGVYKIVPRQGRVGLLYTSHFATCPAAPEWRVRPPTRLKKDALP